MERGRKGEREKKKKQKPRRTFGRDSAVTFRVSSFTLPKPTLYPGLNLPSHYLSEDKFTCYCFAGEGEKGSLGWEKKKARC